MTAPTVNDTRALADMPLFDNETLKCPYHFDKTLRETAPVFKDPTSGVYVVSTYDLVREAHKKPEVFSNDFALAKGAGESIDEDVAAVMSQTYDLGKGTLLTVDDPVHKTYRDELKDFFLLNNVAKYRPWITELADDLFSQLKLGEPVNFVEHFTRPLPLSVIMHVLGMPLEMRDLAFKWTVDNVTVLSQVGDKQTLLAAHAGLKDEYDWFVNALNERRENPRDDLLNLVAHATYEGRPLTIEEQLSHCTQFMVAGNETTTATLAEGMRQLCLNPEQQKMIREDRSLIPNLVDESLRVASPTSNMWRVAKADYDLGGTTIPAGSMVLLKYFSSNHDESMFENPLEFDVTRANAKRHISFGFGSHVCIGQHLSKLEMTIAWEKLFDSSSNFTLACDPSELEYMPNILLRGLEEIPVIIEA
ncbi:cytochrome P450 [Oceanicoccus sp. KOV_DT_Chl]|uniref:cytochrome P450 n=1 Tax=Oceanicoccus sp. KOV_DT_Chl TaxID=1904639 RepID=UPI000C79663E|nr:cytochrome P450 [Oceanicoccus sp. KOV_DT_Chl]